MEYKAQYQEYLLQATAALDTAVVDRSGLRPGCGRLDDDSVDRLGFIAGR